MEEKEEKKDFHKTVLEETENLINQLMEQNISNDNLDILYKLVDIHKDICNEKYWERKVDIMNYGAYGNYNAGYGNYGNQGGYGGYDTYNRRGVPGSGSGRYRGHDQLDRMYDDYGRYSENRRRYGAGQETDKSFHYMVESLENFIKVLYEEAETPQQKQKLMEALQKSMM